MEKFLIWGKTLRQTCSQSFSSFKPELISLLIESVKVLSRLSFLNIESDSCIMLSLFIFFVAIGFRKVPKIMLILNEPFDNGQASKLRTDKMVNLGSI